MLKPPIILPIVRSKLALFMECSLWGAVVVLGFWVAGTSVAVILLLFAAALGWRAYWRQPVGVLSLSSTTTHIHAHWRLSNGHASKMDTLRQNEAPVKAYPVSCDYLGPWLIGLHVGQQRLWLWPDSAPQARLRDVRKLFHSPGR